MTEVRELAIELREIADAGHEVSGAADTMRQAASAIEALSAQVEELRADHTEAQEIIAAFKDEVAKLAADDPEFEAVMRQRYPVPPYGEAASKGSAKKYREAAMLALLENVRLREDLRKARALASEQTGG